MGSMWAIWRCTWDLCGRSWVALGAYVGGLGDDQCEKWPKPEREGDLALDMGRKVALA